MGRQYSQAIANILKKHAPIIHLNCSRAASRQSLAPLLSDHFAACYDSALYREHLCLESSDVDRIPTLDM